MNERFKLSPGSVAAGVDHLTVGSSTTSSAGPATIRRYAAPPLPASNKGIENPVYGYIRAIRALDRTEILPSEIAAALSIPTPAVLEALKALQDKGVKFNK